MTTSLRDKTAVITGASSGIGKQIALRLLEQGMKLCLLGRNVSALEEVAGAGEPSSSRASCYRVDFASEPDVKAVCESLRREVNQVDVLVHSAGTIVSGPLELASIEDFDRQYRVNVRAPYALTQALLPMLKARQGQVVFINSSAGLNAGSGSGQYAATKFALKAIADSFRHEVNTCGVRVLSIYPGRTASPMQAAIFKMEGREYRPELLLQPSEIADLVLTALTLPRSAEVTDINVRPFIKSS